MKIITKNTEFLEKETYKEKGVIIIGISGSGKSTLLNAIGGC